MGRLRQIYETMPLRFRVWDKVLQRFVQYKDIYPQSSCPNEVEIELKDLTVLLHNLSSTPLIISQDTGLKDKNGKSIYTGDIVRSESTPPTTYRAPFTNKPAYAYAYYMDGQVWFMAEVKRYTDAKGQKEIEYHGYAQNMFHGKIVGNIWQNPELLKEEK